MFPCPWSLLPSLPSSAAMSKRVDTKIEDASRDAELERAKDELTAATREAGRLQAEVAALRGDKAIAEDRLAEVERSVEKVAGRLEAARKCQDVDVNQLAHKLGLYMTICPIKWDLDAPEGVLRGRENVAVADPLRLLGAPPTFLPPAFVFVAACPQ